MVSGRRQFVEMLIAFVVGLFLGQQEKPPVNKTTLLLMNPSVKRLKCKELKRSCVQYDFPLEAVGIDTDGKIKRLEDLSYLAI